jgi:YbbR domain-containing protein
MSLNRILHNKKFAIFFSVISAVAIWAAVHSISNEDVKTITTTANLSLNNTYAGNTGMQIYRGDTPKVDITVRGSLFVIHHLTEKDFYVSGDYSEVKGSGDWPVTIRASKSVSTMDFSIVEVKPERAMIFCDFADKKTFAVSADTTNVKIDGKTGYQLGTPTVQAPGIENGTVTIEGPRSVVGKIASVKAVVNKGATISELTTFPATLNAFDEDGKPVKDIELCTFTGLSQDLSVNVVVPVWEKRTIKFNYKYENMPEGFKNYSNFITISPPSIEILGAPEQIDTFADEIAYLGVFDFNHISLDNKNMEIQLDIPQAITVIDGTTEVDVAFKMDGFISKKLEIRLDNQNTTVINRPDGASYSLSTQKISVTLIGDRNSINKIKASDLSAVIDMANEGTAGVREFKAIIKVKGYKDVWVYYGTSESGYTAYLTIS